jgi:hypothetical protein
MGTRGLSAVVPFLSEIGLRRPAVRRIVVDTPEDEVVAALAQVAAPTLVISHHCWCCRLLGGGATHAASPRHAGSRSESVPIAASLRTPLFMLLKEDELRSLAAPSTIAIRGSSSC